MEFQSYNFSANGVDYTANELTSMTLEDANNVFQNKRVINNRDGLQAAYINFVDEDGNLNEFRANNFLVDFITASIPVSTINNEYGNTTDKFLNYQKHQTPVLHGQEWLDFFFMQLPEGMSFPSVIIKKMLNYLSNYMFGQHYALPIYIFNPINLSFRQPVFFDLSVNGNSVTVNVSDSTGALQYKINDGEWQDSNTFANVEVGEHIVYVKDDNSTSAKSVKILTNQ